MSKGGGGQSNTIEKADPWSGIQPYLTDLYAQAKSQYHQGPQQFFPGTTYAGFTPEQLQGQQMALQYADALPGMLAPTLAGNQFLASGAALSPESNPYLAQHAAAAAQPITDQLLTQALPAIRGESLRSGAYGGSRQGLAEGGAIGGAAQAIGNITSGIYSDAYAQGLDAMGKAQALAPSIAGLGMLPSTIYGDVGAQTQAMNQAGINEAIQRYQFNQNAPANALAQYAGILAGIPLGGYGSTSTAAQLASNPMMGAAGGGMMGYGISNMLGYSGPWGAAIGALLGYMSS